MNKKKTLIISIIILLVAAGVTALIFLTEPEAKRSGATKQTAMLVETVEVEHGTFQPDILVTGSVQPARDIILSPLVSGNVVSLADGFVPGGFVKEGEVLLQINPQDYRNTLQLRQSDLQQAQAELEMEQGRQDVARQDYQLVEEMLDSQNLGLVLRQPQLNTVKARIEAAKASVEQARLNLQRTTIRAPFDAHVLRRNANVGSQVAPGDNLGRLVGRDTYWVVLSVPVDKLPWIEIPRSKGERGSEVLIRDRRSWPDSVYRTGYVHRLVGALEDQTRLARIIVEVPDPLGYEKDSLPGLMINAFVEARIQAAKVKDVTRLNRDYLREDQSVWVMQDSVLQIRKVDILLMDARYAYIRSGLHPDDQVVMTNLATVVEGAKLRTRQRDSTSAPGSETEAETPLVP